MRQDQAGNNFGGLATLTVRRGTLVGANARRAFASFDYDVQDARFARIVAVKARFKLSAVTAGRTVQCHEVVGAAWTEGGLTWNNQPAVGDLVGTVATEAGQTVHEFDVDLEFLDPAVPDGTLRVRLRDSQDAGGTDNFDQVYHAREAASAGDRPELEVEWEALDHTSFPSTVTVPASAHADLPSALTVPFTATRFGQVRRTALLDAADGPTTPQGIAYDAGRDAFWVADQQARKVRRYDRRMLALQREYALPAGFSPAGCAYDGAFLWLSDDLDANEIRKFSVGEDALTQEGAFAHQFRTALAWDGAALWSVDTIGGVVYEHAMDQDLTVERSFAGLPETWGLAFPSDGADPYTLENAGAADFRIRRRSVDDWSLLASWAYAGDHDARPFGLAFAPGRATHHAYNAEETSGDLLLMPGLDLAASVQPRVRGAAGLDGSVTARVAASAELGSLVTAQLTTDTAFPSQVTPRFAGAGDLASAARPRLAGSAGLETAVLPRLRSHAGLASAVVARVSSLSALPSGVTPRFAAAAELASAVRPTEVPVTVKARARGTITEPVVPAAEDFAAITAEVGSLVQHTSGGVTTGKRRVVQLVDTVETRQFPRETTSEALRDSTQDVLRRGDAILYALRGDAFLPGDTVAWAGHAWVVIGGLGWERVGEVDLYQEVGLRRLSAVARARVTGTVGVAA